MTTAPSVKLIAGHRRAPILLVRLARTGFDTLGRWRARQIQRSKLASLDDHMLRDIGLTRLDRRRECAKPFWRP
ncbi:MAG: DUF1127 domain-containing protein [Mesorhizobium sp.]|nr:DUF1127 domain-containing protein [Mesorhizobium sp.]